MNAERKGVGIRVGLEGGEVVKRGFNEIADSGKKMFAELAVGSKVAAPGIESLNAGSKGLQEGLAGVEGAGGLAARGLGLASIASVGATAALAAVTAAVLQAREAMKFADELADQARAVGVSTDALQEYQYVLEATGGSGSDAAKALGDFREKFGAARAELSREAVSPFKALGLSADDLKHFPTAEAALAEVVKRIGELSDAAEQAAIAEKLGLEPLLPALQMGADAIANLRQEAHELGVVMDAELVRRAAEAQDEFDTLSKVIDVQLKSAIVDLAPVITATIGLVADLARAFSDMADAWRDLDSKSTRGLEAQLSKARIERDKLGIQDMLADPARTPNAEFIQTQRTLEMGRLEAQIFDLEQRLAQRDAASRPATPTGSGSLRGSISSPRRAAAAGPKGLTEEEKAAGLAALKLEQDLAVARAEGNELLIERLQTLKFINEQAEKYVKLGMSEADARAQADYDAMRREAAAERKRQEDLFGKSVVDVGSSPNVDSQAPDLVIGPDGKAWTPEQKAAWARSVGEATADGLDYVLNGGDIGDWILQLFYRNALEGLSAAMAEGLNNADFSAMGGDANGNWLLSAVQWTGSIFAGQPQGRAAGGPMGQGYNFGEHGRPELGMFSNGFVADHDTTQRMLVDAVAQANQASGARGGGGAQRIEMHVSTDLKIPPGYIPDAGLRALFAQHQQQTVALIAENIGPMARIQQSQDYELKE